MEYNIDKLIDNHKGMNEGYIKSMFGSKNIRLKVSKEIVDFIRSSADMTQNNNERFYHIYPVYQIDGEDILIQYDDYNELPDWVSFMGRIKRDGKPGMSGLVKVLSTHLSFNPYTIPGKPDKRYRSGWRVLPVTGNSTVLAFKLENDGRFKIMNYWNLGEFGTFCVTSCSALDNSANFIQVMSKGIEAQSLTIPNEILVNYKGSIKGEDSQ